MQNRNFSKIVVSHPNARGLFPLARYGSRFVYPAIHSEIIVEGTVCRLLVAVPSYHLKIHSGLNKRRVYKFFYKTNSIVSITLISHKTISIIEKIVCL